jgi:hypothetical protein
LDYILKLAKEKNKLLSAIPAIQPVRNENLRRMVLVLISNRSIYQGAENAWGWTSTAKTGAPFCYGDGIVVEANSRAFMENMWLLGMVMHDMHATEQNPVRYQIE